MTESKYKVCVKSWMIRLHQKFLVEYMKKTKRCIIQDKIKDCDIICIDPHYHTEYHKKNPTKIFNSVSDEINLITEKHNLGGLVKNEKFSIPTLEVKKGVIPKEMETWNKKDMYIIKPIFACGGKGIEIKNYKNTLQYIQSENIDEHIIQPLIKPKLINGTKFDIRLYVFLSNKGEFFVSEHGMIRFAYKKYKENTGDLKVNLTNTSLDHKKAKISEFSKWKYKNKYMPDIQKMVQTVVEKVMEKNSFRGTGAHILGFDIMIDKNENVRLIEINKSPSMKPTNEISRSLKEKMVEDYIQFLDSINIKN